MADPHEGGNIADVSIASPGSGTTQMTAAKAAWCDRRWASKDDTGAEVPQSQYPNVWIDKPALRDPWHIHMHSLRQCSVLFCQLLPGLSQTDRFLPATYQTKDAGCEGSSGDVLMNTRYNVSQRHKKDCYTSCQTLRGGGGGGCKDNSGG